MNARYSALSEIGFVDQQATNPELVTGHFKALNSASNSLPVSLPALPAPIRWKRSPLSASPVP